MNNNQLEYNLCIVLLYATGYDGVISDQELDNMIAILTELFQGIGREDNPLDYLAAVIEETKLMTPEKLFEHTTTSVLFLKENLNEKDLRITFEAVKHAMSDHTHSEQEVKFLGALSNMWAL